MPQCITPLIIRSKMDNCSISVPCGRCPNCLKARASAWSFRLLHEAKVSTSAWFLTLTYDTKNVPITNNGFMQLQKRDLQLFMKRLRKEHWLMHKKEGKPLVTLKYYACGEYGGQYKRPHYHMLLFNADHTKVQNAWQHGSIHYGQVTPASVGYTLKYMHKGVWKPMHQNDDRLKEFSLMSKGLGASYLNDKTVSWHKANLLERMYCNLEGGKKITMPRYYKDRIYTEIERKRIAHFAKLKAEAELAANIATDENFFVKQSSLHQGCITQFNYRANQGRNKF